MFKCWSIATSLVLYHHILLLKWWKSLFLISIRGAATWYVFFQMFEIAVLLRHIHGQLRSEIHFDIQLAGSMAQKFLNIPLLILD